MNGEGGRGRGEGTNYKVAFAVLDLSWPFAEQAFFFGVFGRSPVVGRMISLGLL